MFDALRFRLKDRNLLTLVKLAEVGLLGRFASTYCYNRPSHVYLELTARCNLRCGWCIQAHSDFREGHTEDMPFEMFEEIVSGLRGTKVLYLCLNGEPLLYDRIVDAVALARRTIPSVRFVTNGLLLDRDVAKELKQAGLSELGVSIDGTDPELMERIRGLSLETVVQNVTSFSRQTGIPVEVRSAICKENLSSLMSLPELVRRFPTGRSLYFTLAEGLDEVEKSPMTMLRDRAAFEEFKRTVVSKCREYGLQTNLGYMQFYADGFFSKTRQGRCDSLFGRHLAINHRGHILPCCRYWGATLDSIAGTSFPAAWNGPGARAWRQKMLNGEFTPECANWCGFSPAYNQQT